ncbi:hypothetical protein GGI07_001768 [Coemansia sp. Benny D115]|nr:hypothetical protein GGI07_001768 [Coemansia sp. Benny D115]
MAADKGGSTPPKLPLNARRTPAQPMPIARSPFQPSQQQQRPYAQSLSHSLGNNAPRPSSFAKATSLLSQPGYLAQHHPSMSPNECTNDSDSVSSSLKRQAAWAIERAEVARRLKRHLVTRPAPTPTRSAALDDGGYAGDTNEEDDELDPHALSADAHEVVDPLQLPSGDITYQIYRWQNKNKDIAPSLRSGLGSESPVAPQSTSGTRGRRESAAANLPRRRSFSAWDSDPEWDLSYRSNQINVPGGFRRQFVRERAERQGRAPPGLIAETFVDFIALYGHFAGGNYLSDEDEEYFDYVHQSYADAAAAADDEETRQPVDERTPLRRVQSSGALHATSSNRKAFFLLIKAFVGTGVLVLPRAFYNGGLLTSCVLMLLVAWYAWHCILLLAEVYLKIGGGSYSDIGLRLYGRWMQYAVTSSIVLAQIGGCCAYTIFVAQNWRNVFNTLSRCHVQLSTEFWVLVQLVVFIPLALIRQIRYFAPVAMLANLLIVVSLGYLLGFDLWSIASNGPAPIANYNPARFPLLVGTAVYSFEGVTLVIPIIESLKEKRDFARVLTLAITLCLGLFLCVGSLSYLTFGESVEAVVLLNMPNDSSWTMLVQLLYSIAILFSMPIQLFPAVKIMEAMMFTRSGRLHKSVKWQKNIFRTVTAIFIAIIAIFGADQLDNVVSLVGSFCLVPLSFIYPSSMHLKLVADTTWMRVKDSILIVVGVAAMIYVTFISITTWGTSDPPIDVCKPSP